MFFKIKQSISFLTLFSIGVIGGNANADAILFEDNYPDEVPYIDIYSFPEYGKAEVDDSQMTKIWESSPELKNETYYTKPHTIVKENGKVKYALAYVRGAGYAMPEEFSSFVLINCQNPRNSYIERGDRERISLKDSMNIGGKYGPGLGDERWSVYVPRGAVNQMFKLYCK